MASKKWQTISMFVSVNADFSFLDSYEYELLKKGNLFVTIVIHIM